MAGASRTLNRYLAREILAAVGQGSATIS